MIDNRPKKRRKITPPVVESPALPPIPEEKVHSGIAPVSPADVHSTAVGGAATGAVRKKSLPLGPLSGLMNGLGGIGGIGGAGILPIVLAVGALQRGRGQPARPVAPAAAPAAVEAAPPPLHGPEPQAARKPRGSLRSAKKPPEPAVIEAAADPAPVKAADPAPARPPRPAPRPQEIRSLLNDLSGYLPGTGSAQASRVSRIMGIAEELRSMNSPGVSAAAALPANPMDRNIGVLNALSRNLPFAGANNLGRASQVLTLVNTLKGGGIGQGMGNLSNMAGMLSGMMGQNPLGGMMNQSQPHEPKNVTPAQADGLKDTVNKLLSGMDDKQKDELLDKAKDLLGRVKK